MDDQRGRTTHRIAAASPDRALQHRLTRRGLLQGAAGLGAGALALSVAGPARTQAGRWVPLTTADQYSARVPLEWFRLLFDIMPTTPGFGPGVGNRAHAYLGITLYEAVVDAMPGFETLAGRLNELSPPPPSYGRAYHWPSVANAALAQSMRELLRMTPEENMAAINDLEASLAEELTARAPLGIASRSARQGRRMADHIMAWAKTDGAHDGHLPEVAFPPDYVPPAGPGLWVPTPPAFRPAVDPYGGSVRPMALGAIEDFDPGPPPEFSTDPASEFYAIENEVYETVNNLTDEQLATALYWATTLGHHTSLTVQAIEAQNGSLATAAATFARTGMAIFDAGKACFYGKYKYNLLRPITYIREHIDSNWGDPLPVTTPPHPDYPAAHATVTYALAQALHDQFGDFTFTDTTWVFRGMPARTWDSWFEMATETGISRLYGGIHTRVAIEVGFEQGRRIGDAVGAVFN